MLLRIVPLALLLAVPSSQQPTSPAAVEARARAIIASLNAGEFAKIEAQYDEQLALALPPGALAKSWAASAAQLGPFESVTGVQVQQVATSQVAIATCAFQNYIVTLRIVFTDKGRISNLVSTGATTRAKWMPPDYADESTFVWRAVTVKTGRWEMPGILTVPKAAGQHPAVVLVHGSGPQDMDESLGPNKMFTDLAYGLASRGVAVLRYEKRTHKYHGQSSDDPAKLTVKDEAMDDAASAVAMLAAMPEIDPRKIIVAGHSEGAYLAPRIASGNPQIAGIVLLAGNVRPMEDLIVEQVKYEASLAGQTTPAVQKAIADAEASANELKNPDLKPGMTVHVLTSTLPASYVLDMRAYRPAEVGASLKIPMLVLQGERDYQVTMTDFALWQKALAGHANATLKSYQGLNHFFMMGTGPASPADYVKAGHVERVVIDDIATFCTNLAK